MNVSALFIRRPVATLLLLAALALAGALGYALLPVAPLPQFEYPIISVSANLPGASPETMAATVATPLERTLGSIAGVNEVTSQSTLGSTRITLQFDLDRDIDSAARSVQAGINAARASLPSGMPGNPSWRKANPVDPPIMILALTSQRRPVGELFDMASTVVAQRLAQVQGVGDVLLGGASLPAVRVAVDPNRLAADGLSLEQVRAAIVANNVSRPKGVLEDGGRHWQLGANDQARTAADYRPVVLSWRSGAAVRLADVAEVRDSVQDVRAYGLSDGRPAVMLLVQKAPNANVVQAVDEVRRLLPQLRAALPEGTAMDVIMDRTLAIRESLREVQRTLAVSVLLVVLVVYAFLRRWRATLIPAVVVPVSLVGTFGVMALCGHTLDNLSLMALIVATGFVVDDAIVVLEHISRHIERGKTPLRAALDGAREIWFTVLSISLALMAAFIPILYMGGILGRLFREFAVVLCAAIVISMLVSLTATPMLAARLLRPAAPRVPGSARGAGRLGAALRALQRGWRRSLRWVLRHQPLGLAALAAVVWLNGWLYAHVDKGFIPQQDNGRLIGSVVADQGSSFLSLKAKLDAYMDIILADPAVAHATATTGGQRNGAQVFIALKPLAERGLSPDAVADRLRPRLARVPGAALFLRPGQDVRLGGRQSSSEYQYTLQADDLRELMQWEPRIRRAMGRLEEITDVDGDRQDRGPQTSVVIDRDAASSLGVSVRAVDNALYNAFGQRQVGVIYNALNQYRVVLELEPRFLQSPDALRNLYVTSAAGQQVPLSALARVESTLAPLTVNHDKGTPATTLSFNLAAGVSLSQATEAVENAVARLGVPASVRGSFSGTANAFRDSLRSQPLLILAAVLTIYILLGMLYESLLHPLTILSTLPSAGVGALLALMLFRTEFSVIAMIGVVLLVGIVMKNAIMMIDFAIARQKRAVAGGGGSLSAGAAIYRAAQLRLRPILMTTLAALLGALPLALGQGAGAELRQPLGMAIVGGLVLCQLLTLYTTPVVFVALERLATRLRRRRGAGRFPRALPTPV